MASPLDWQFLPDATITTTRVSDSLGSIPWIAESNAFCRTVHRKCEHPTVRKNGRCSRQARLTYFTVDGTYYHLCRAHAQTLLYRTDEAKRLRNWMRRVNYREGTT